MLRNFLWQEEGGAKCDLKRRILKQVQDVLKTWRHLYMKKGWHRFGMFDSKGGFDNPYPLSLRQKMFWTLLQVTCQELEEGFR